MEDLQPDTEAKVIRFICGSLIGFLASFVAFHQLFPASFDSPVMTWLFIALGTLLAGYWAMKYGDYFWKHLLKRW